MLLSRDQILAAPVPTRDVEVPEWGGTVRVQAHSVKRRFAYAEAMLAHARALKEYEDDQALEEPTGIAKPRLIADSTLRLIYSIVDDNGDLMFSVADMDLIDNLSYDSLEKLYHAFLELNVTAPTAQTVEAKKKSSAKSPKNKSFSI